MVALVENEMKMSVNMYTFMEVYRKKRKIRNWKGTDLYRPHHMEKGID